jgi:hypothetical protein
MESTYCAGCANYLSMGKCLAFPEKIPEDIFYGLKEHEKPIPKQGNNIVFEPID